MIIKFTYLISPVAKQLPNGFWPRQPCTYLLGPTLIPVLGHSQFGTNSPRTLSIHRILGLPNELVPSGLSVQKVFCLFDVLLFLHMAQPPQSFALYQGYYVWVFVWNRQFPILRYSPLSILLSSPKGPHQYVVSKTSSVSFHFVLSVPILLLHLVIIIFITFIINLELKF